MERNTRKLFSFVCATLLMNREQLQDRIDQLSLQMAYIPYNSPKIMEIMQEIETLEVQLAQLLSSGTTTQQTTPNNSTPQAYSNPLQQTRTDHNLPVYLSNVSSPLSQPQSQFQTSPQHYNTTRKQYQNSNQQTQLPKPSANVNSSFASQQYQLPQYMSQQSTNQQNTQSYIHQQQFQPTQTQQHQSPQSTTQTPSYASYHKPLAPQKNSISLTAVNSMLQQPELQKRNTWAPQSFNQHMNAQPSNSPQSQRNETYHLPKPDSIQIPSRPATVPKSLVDAVAATPTHITMAAATPPPSPMKQNKQSPFSSQLPIAAPQYIPAYLANMGSSSPSLFSESTQSQIPIPTPDEEIFPSEEQLAREARLNERESELALREEKLQEMERNLRVRAQELDQREVKLTNLEETLRKQKQNQIQVLRLTSSVKMPKLTGFDEQKVILCQRQARKFVHQQRLIAGTAKPYNIKELVLQISKKDQKEFKEKKKNRFYWVSMKEILQTEESYVSDLALIINNYMGPILASDVIKTSEVQTIFGNIDTIYRINSEFLKDLRYGFFQLETYDPQLPLSMGKLLQQLPQYAPYYINFEKSNMLRQKLKSNSKYVALLEYLQKESPTPFYDLDSYLIKPCQRLPRYKLLIDAVLKNMSKKNVMRPVFEQLLENTGNAVTQINEVKRRDENKQKVIALEEKLNCPNNFKLADGSRLYEYHAPLGVLAPRSLKHQWKTGRIGYLFSDILLVARTRYLSSNQAVLCIVDLKDNVILEELEDTQELWNCFKIQQGDVIIHFITETVESKQIWIENIRRIIATIKSTQN